MGAEPSHGVIPALDVSGIDEVLRLVEATTGIDGVVGYKISQRTVLEIGLVDAVRALRTVTDRPLYYDHQKAGLDVPSNGAGFASAVASARVDGVIVFPVAGPTAVRGFVRGALDHGVRPIVGAALPLPDFTISGGGWLHDDVLARVAALALAEGARDVVVPAHDLRQLETVTGELTDGGQDPTFFLPGIGAEGSPLAAAFSAVRGPRAHAIVGRAIHADPDPAAATRRLADTALAAATH
ncbi:orotidine 5'-phosphate decarboxylase [Pseudonocardia endophytica]|uniref:Orotidine-5'-phosphate decarboxylase n=1 Tax=Pseudonocardia endophytica TaxID=401976 RepID=A0A4R1HHK3_PSEEN|nr:orotidine 5'-phosphate decarboxylase [Pseudonocardia endophytica]TCK19915.1 orotidine-5'-phosphate decarboxylase [Pseudonocardia endophytica]